MTPFKAVYTNTKNFINDRVTKLTIGKVYDVVDINDYAHPPTVFYKIAGYEQTRYGTEAWYDSIHFTPIVTNYSDATAEILEKFKSPAERPDKILTPEKVTNQ